MKFTISLLSFPVLAVCALSIAADKPAKPKSDPAPAGDAKEHAIDAPDVADIPTQDLRVAPSPSVIDDSTASIGFKGALTEAALEQRLLHQQRYFTELTGTDVRAARHVGDAAACGREPTDVRTTLIVERVHHGS